MLFLRSRSILTLVFAATLIAIIGCGGMSNSASNPSNPAAPPPGGNPGGTGGGAGGGTPQSSTFVYFHNGFQGQGDNNFVFKLGSDGSLTAMSGSPFSSPELVTGQSHNFLVGATGSGSTFGPSLFSVNPQTGIPQSQISHVNDGSGPNDSNNLYTSAQGNGINAYAISSGGQLSLIPGSPFDAQPPSQFFTNSFGPIQIVGSFLFGSVNTVKDAGGIEVFSRGANGALTLKFGFGNGNSPFGFVIAPSAHFAYVTSDVPSLDVYSLDMNANSATLIQQVQLHDQTSGGGTALDPAGKLLFMHDNGMRVFSVDQTSGKLTEVAGSPFLANDNGITTFDVDPGGHFLIVEHQNSINVYSIGPAGTLTQVGPSYAAGNNLAGITFATF